MLFVGDLKVKGMPDCINNEYVASKLSKTIYNVDFCYYMKEKLQFVEFFHHKSSQWNGSQKFLTDAAVKNSSWTLSLN